MTTEKVKAIFTTATDAKIAEFVDVWNTYAHDFEIDNEFDEDILLTTIVHEVGTDLISVRENLNYTPEALRSTFSRYKNNPNWSERDGRTDAHAADQVMIGNVAYADRYKNGNIASGDGYKYRGGGLIQLTFKANYETTAYTISKLTEISLDANMLVREITTMKIGLLATFAFFHDNDLDSCKNMDECTNQVNYHTSSRQARNETYGKISQLA